MWFPSLRPLDDIGLWDLRSDSKKRSTGYDLGWRHDVSERTSLQYLFAETYIETHVFQAFLVRLQPSLPTLAIDSGP